MLAEMMEYKTAASKVELMVVRLVDCLASLMADTTAELLADL